jgi:uroporphyrinogen decarboxylase
MKKKERQLHRIDMADTFIATAERFEHSAIFLHPNPDTVEETEHLVDLVRENTGDTYFLLRHGDATFLIPAGDGMLDFFYRLADEPDKVKLEAQSRVDQALARAEWLRKQNHGLDGFALCSDYCFNAGPFSAQPCSPNSSRLTS